LLDANGVWKSVKTYMKKSYVMEGDYLKEPTFNIEDEAY